MATAAHPTPPADCRAPGAFLAGPHSLRERMAHLRLDAARILAAPEAYRLEEIRWAEAMVASAPTGRAEARE